MPDRYLLSLKRSPNIANSAKKALCFRDFFIFFSHYICFKFIFRQISG